MKKGASLLYPANPSFVRDTILALLKQEGVHSLSEKVRDEFLGKMHDLLPTILEKQKKGTPEYRFARALLQDLFPYSFIEKEECVT